MKLLFREINSSAGYFWKSLKNDNFNYIQTCPVCIKNKAGKTFKPGLTIIILKGPKERFVVDSWKIHKLAKICGYEYVLGIIGHFSKYMPSFPIEKK